MLDTAQVHLAYDIWWLQFANSLNVLCNCTVKISFTTNTKNIKTANLRVFIMLILQKTWNKSTCNSERQMIIYVQLRNNKTWQEILKSPVSTTTKFSLHWHGFPYNTQYTTVCIEQATTSCCSESLVNNSWFYLRKRTQSCYIFYLQYFDTTEQASARHPASKNANPATKRLWISLETTG